ncbi:cytochrome-c peroxidase [Verrucomicrobiota bacterium sgz303538]
MPRKPRPIHLVASIALLAVSPLTTRAADAAKPDVAQLRERAKTLFGTLPDKMPGAEKDTPELVSLGRELFFDKRLSANDSQSCNSCHAVDNNRGGVDNEPTSLGAFGKRGGRNSPTVLNAGFQFVQFWDGRAADLPAQAKGPVLNPVEMGMKDDKAVISKLAAVPEYQAAFKKLFQGASEPLNYDNVAQAIAAFERTLVTRDRFDDFLKGDDKALTEKEVKGLDTFMTVGCVACHNGPLLGGNSFQKLGLVNALEKISDQGRYEVTKDEADRFKFKVPTLRNIAITGPYFHDGETATLEEAVRRMSWLQLGQKLSDEQVNAIVAFLHTLTDKPRAAVVTAAN